MGGYIPLFQTHSLQNVAQDNYFKPQDLTCLLSIYFNPSSLQKAFSSPGTAIVWPSGHTKRRAPCRVQCGCLLLEMAFKMLLTRMLRDLPGPVCHHALLYWMVIKAIQSLRLHVKMAEHQVGHVNSSALLCFPPGMCPHLVSFWCQEQCH